MQSMNSQREIADSFVQIVMEGFKKENNLIYLKRYLMGYSVWALPVRNQRGELENDYNSVLLGIYDYHREHPRDRVDHLTEDALIDILQTGSKISYVQNTARIVQHHLNNEAQHTALFTINRKKVLQAYRENLARNKADYEASTKYPTFSYINAEISRITKTPFP